MMILTNILKSFNNEPGGFSARKLTAFWLICLTTFVHYKYCTEKTAVEFVMWDLIFAFAALGLINIEKMIPAIKGTSGDGKGASGDNKDTSGDGTAEKKTDDGK